MNSDISGPRTLWAQDVQIWRELIQTQLDVMGNGVVCLGGADAVVRRDVQKRPLTAVEEIEVRARINDRMCSVRVSKL